MIPISQIKQLVPLKNYFLDRKKKKQTKEKFWSSLYKYLINKESFLTEFISIDKELFV